MLTKNRYTVLMLEGAEVSEELRNQEVAANEEQERKGRVKGYQEAGNQGCKLGKEEMRNSASKDIRKMLLALTKEVKTGFSISESNMKDIQGACEALEKKLVSLTQWTQVPKTTVLELKGTVDAHKEEISRLCQREKEVQWIICLRSKQHMEIISREVLIGRRQGISL
ncbi:hypothetical protein NDU88_001033 [Pleurodeles waltl]|uniref:Uncharacterized protein n=1 Tax=Pleurodeles waltl TaxID=8319 RepID=A0AAV7S8P3_PLEWA|nr:hypothetical protein NDU88_001033 [Pleurodeles waltl]